MTPAEEAKLKLLQERVLVLEHLVYALLYSVSDRPSLEWALKNIGLDYDLNDAMRMVSPNLPFKRAAPGSSKRIERVRIAEGG